MEKQCQLLTYLVESLNPLGLELFVRHYIHSQAFEGECTTVIPFVELDACATLSCIQEVLATLPSLKYQIDNDVVQPVVDVIFDFNDNQVMVRSDASVLHRMNCDIPILTQLLKLSSLSNFDRCVYLNMVCFGNHLKQWDIQGLKDRYGCQMDDDIFTQYILDF